MSALTNFLTPAEQAVEDTFRRLAETTDVFERYAHPHAIRIADLTDAMAAAFKLPGHDRRALRIAALAHDLGEAKMERDYIQLQLPSRLSIDEQMDLARHPVIGEQEAARNGADKAAQLLVRWHHEWWNGDGYPDGLRREQIPLAARILRVCDAFAALTDDRPYRSALTVAEAKRHLTEWAGLEFDPQVVKIFFEIQDPQLIRSFAEPVEVVVSTPSTTPEGEDIQPASEVITAEFPASELWPPSSPPSPSMTAPISEASSADSVPLPSAPEVDGALPAPLPASDPAEPEPAPRSMFSDQ